MTTLEVRLARECDALRGIGSDTTKQLHYFCAAPQHARSEVVTLCLTPSAQQASTEVVKLCLTSRNCGHAMLLTTIALVATSTHSFLATLLAVALVALLPDSDIDTAETP